LPSPPLCSIGYIADAFKFWFFALTLYLVLLMFTFFGAGPLAGPLSCVLPAGQPSLSFFLSGAIAGSELEALLLRCIASASPPL